jgi:hypothetical protein
MAFKYLTMACKSCSSITIPFKDCAFFEMSKPFKTHVHRRYDAWYVVFPIGFLRANFPPVTNKVFSIILSAYVEGLAASIKASCEGLPALSQTSGLSTYKSIEQLDVVLDFAKQCLFRFKEPVDNMENVEKKSCEAIELLTKRYVYNCYVVLHHLLELIL